MLSLDSIFQKLSRDIYYVMINKNFSLTYQVWKFSFRVFGFCNDKVSVSVFENIIVGYSFSRPFLWYIILFCSSNLRWFHDLYIPWENGKVHAYVVFKYLLALWSFSKLFFAKTILDTKLKLSRYTNYDNIYRLVLNRRMSTFTMVRWYVLSLNMWRYDIMYNSCLNGTLNMCRWGIK